MHQRTKRVKDERKQLLLFILIALLLFGTVALGVWLGVNYRD